MTREMYESLALTDLRGIAKQRRMKIPAGSKKADIIDMMLAQDQSDASNRQSYVREASAVSAGIEDNAAEKSAGEESGKETGTDGTETVTGKPERRKYIRKKKSAVQEQEKAAAENDMDNGRMSEENSGAAAAEPAPDSDKQIKEKTAARVKRDTEAPLGDAGQKPVNKKNVSISTGKASFGRGTRGAKPSVPAESIDQRPAFEDVFEVAAMEKEADMMAKEEYGRNAGQSQIKTVQQTPEQPAAKPAPQPQPLSQQLQPQSSSLEDRYARRGLVRPDQAIVHKNELNKELDSGEMANGILEVMPDGYGFIRSANYMPGDDDVYVAPSQIRRFNLKTGDIIQGNIRIKTQSEKFSALLFVKSVNGLEPEVAKKRFNFEDMTPVFPDDKIRLEKTGSSVAMRVMDLMAPVGKGQRGMIVSPPKAGKTTLVKEIAKSVTVNNPEIHLIILLIDERPEEVTDIKEAIRGDNVEVIYSTFDERPEHHKRVSEMVIERAKRLVEQKRDVMILLDSITRLTRAYNLTEPSSGRTLSGGLDPAALHMPKRFFGAARNMREGGSLTILATALIETGSKMDDVVYEEFKGTGNMELILNRKLSERRIFPAVDLAASGTRRDDLLLTPDEMEAVSLVRKSFIGNKAEEATDSVLDLFYKTRSNGEFVSMIRKHQWSY